MMLLVPNAAAHLMATGGVSSTCTTGSSGNIKIESRLKRVPTRAIALHFAEWYTATDPANFLIYSVFSDSGGQ